jgi:hypothetical protein
MRAAVARPAPPLQLRTTRTASARLARAGASRSAGSGGLRSRDGGASGGGGPSSGAGGGPKQAKRRRAGREQDEGHLEWSSSASASMGGDEERDTGGSPAMSDAMFQVETRPGESDLHGAAQGLHGRPHGHLTPDA